jgi:hypothetical protein
MKNYLETNGYIMPFENIKYIKNDRDVNINIYDHDNREIEFLCGKEATDFINNYREWRESLINKVYIPIKEQSYDI